MQFKVKRNDSANPMAGELIIKGENLIDAIKNNFEKILYVSTYYHIPFRFPMTVTPSYKPGILGGKGGVELKLEWMHSDYSDKPKTPHTHTIWIYANESDLVSTESFTILGK